MAQFKKLNSGWQVRIYYYDKFGRRKSMSKNGFQTKKMAQDYATQYEYAYKNGGDLQNKDVTLLDYFMKWYQTFREPRLSANTKTKYEYTIRTVHKYFGQTKLGEITPAIYQQFLNDYGNGKDEPDFQPHAKATVSKVNTHIRAAVRNAVNDGVITSDFTLNTHLTFDASKTREIKYLNEVDAEKLLRYLKRDLNQTIVCPMAYTALMTGMRVSEIAGLTWDCINREKQTLNINKSWNFGLHDFGPTKNPSSNRVIDVTPGLLKVLAQVKFNQNTALKLKHQQNDKNLVFLSHNFKTPDYKTLEDGLRNALQRAGIKQDLTFHGLRHTHASLLLYDRIAIPYISKRLGHQNVDTTIHVYLHIIQELQNEESDKTISYMSQLEEMNI